MEQRYKAISPNRDYNGKTCGVRFENGTAFFDDLTMSTELGLSANEAAKKMRDEFNYTVTTIDGKPIDAVTPAKPSK